MYYIYTCIAVHMYCTYTLVLFTSIAVHMCILYTYTCTVRMYSCIHVLYTCTCTVLSNSLYKKCGKHDQKSVNLFLMSTTVEYSGTTTNLSTIICCKKFVFNSYSHVKTVFSFTMHIFSYMICMLHTYKCCSIHIRFASYSVMLSVHSFMYTAKKGWLFQPISWLPQLHANLIICLFIPYCSIKLLDGKLVCNFNLWY